MNAKRLLIPIFVLVGIVALTPWHVAGWGPKGHEMSGRAAALKLPEEMPRFFRKSVDQLAYLSPEPDRWRDRVEADLDKGMSQQTAADHFIDLELAPRGTLTSSRQPVRLRRGGPQERKETHGSRTSSLPDSGAVPACPG